MNTVFGKHLSALGPGLARMIRQAVDPGRRATRPISARPTGTRPDLGEAKGERTGDGKIDDVARFLRIPTRQTPDLPDDSRRLQDEGQFLARQDRWGDLSDRVRQVELRRTKTTDFMPVSDLLLFGARADVVAAAEHALHDGAPHDAGVLFDGIASLEAVHDEHPDQYPIALVVALAHIDIGWAWRGSGPDRDVSPRARSAFSAHLDRATSILDRYSGIELDSPALAAARCAVLAGSREPHLRVADDYEDLIDLDPTDQRHMRALGNHLLPRWFGSYETLELEARRTASRTQDIWGDAGYTWVYFDAITHDPEACSRVDTDFFIDGLRDILRRRTDQGTVNMLAAYCAVALGEARDSTSPRARIRACADWIIRDHLRELHPLVWAHAAQGFDNSARIRSIQRFADRGRDEALRVIARLFADEIAQGHQVTFTAEGPRIHA